MALHGTDTDLSVLSDTDSSERRYSCEEGSESPPEPPHSRSRPPRKHLALVGQAGVHSLLQRRVSASASGAAAARPAADMGAVRAVKRAAALATSRVATRPNIASEGRTCGAD